MRNTFGVSSLSPASRALNLFGGCGRSVPLRSILGCGPPRASLRKTKSMLRGLVVLFAMVVSLIMVPTGVVAQKGKGRHQASVKTTGNTAPTTPASLLTITTEANAIVWIDDIRRGVTDTSGRLVVTKVSPGRHTAHVRADGFKEATVPLLPGQRSLAVKLLPTTDKAELLFQQAESARDQAKDDESKEKAIALYREAIKIRAAFPAAHVGLARLLMDLNKFQEAHAEIEAARQTRPIYPEASAVQGRIYREAAFADDAIRSFRRSINEARGFQPEAHVGLARVLEDKGQYSEAVVEYRKAIDQLSDSEPVIYQLLGAAYEKLQKPKEAVAAYEKYLELAPNGSLAPALRSILEQLKREAAGQEIIP